MMTNFKPSIPLYTLALGLLLSACSGGAQDNLLGGLTPESKSGSFIEEPIDIPVTIAKVPSVIRPWWVEIEVANGEMVITGMEGVIPGATYRDVLVKNAVNNQERYALVDYENDVCAEKAVENCAGSFEEIRIPITAASDTIYFTPHFVDEKQGLVLKMNINAEGVPIWRLEDDSILYEGDYVDLTSVDNQPRTPLPPPTIDVNSRENLPRGGAFEPTVGRNDLVELPPSSLPGAPIVSGIAPNLSDTSAQ